MEKVLRVEDGKYVTGEVIGAEVELMKLLWENPSPSAAFAAQTVSLDLSDYDFVQIFYRYNIVSGGDMLYTSHLVQNNNRSARNEMVSGDTAATGTVSWWRDVTVGDEGATFGVCTFTNTGRAQTIANDCMIPTKIYGIKNKIQTIAKDVATTADKCMLSDGVTSVEEEITQLNSDLTELQKTGIDNAISLTNGTNYTCPNDGYFVISLTSANQYVYGYIGGKIVFGCNTISPNNVRSGQLFVRKGMVISFYSSDGTNGTGNFYPIIDA